MESNPSLFQVDAIALAPEGREAIIAVFRIAARHGRRLREERERVSAQGDGSTPEALRVPDVFVEEGEP